MSNDCLLLNGNGKPVSYFPLSTINWKTAIRLLFTKNVIIIKNHESWRVRSPSMEVEVPSIIMLRRFHKFQNYVKFSRSNVYLRDMYRCQYCSNFLLDTWIMSMKFKFASASASIVILGMPVSFITSSANSSALL